MNNELELLQEISNQIEQVNTNMEIMQNSFLWFLGLTVAFVVIYLLYKCIDEFISF